MDRVREDLGVDSVLGEVVVSAAVHRLRGDAPVSPAGQHDDGRLVTVVVQAAEKGEAILAREAVVEE